MNDQTQPDVDTALELTNAIEGSGELVETLDVSLSNEIVHLLSEQLYTTPLKAIEELVVNGYDADAAECRVAFLLDQEAMADIQTGDSAGDLEQDHQPELDLVVVANDIAAAPMGLIAIFDDGDGMDVGGLKELWKIGDSPKRRAALDKTSKGRLIIGKFGIGKLATYAVGHRVTYLTASAGHVHHVVCDFRRFHNDPTGGSKPIQLAVRRIDDLTAIIGRADFASVLARLGIDAAKLQSGLSHGWTLCLIDHLKPKARGLKLGRLSWVLRTSMPLGSGFSVYLNGEVQTSSKESIPRPVSFKVGELEPARVAALNEKHGISLSVVGQGLVDKGLFPSGINGEIFVAEKSLLGKSDTLIGRSNGFFVYVRGRLINAEDPLFHNTPLSYETFNRFRADLGMDDLNADVTAPREGIEEGRRRAVASALARELFNQAREKFEKWRDGKDDPKRSPEHVRTYVAPRFVERPVADVLAMDEPEGSGADADRGWFYMKPLAEAALSEVVEQLYTERKRYKFAYIGLGSTERLTKFDPVDAAFTINSDHELVRAFSDEPRSRELMELFATSEVMLEVYMKESGVAPFTIGEVLERRDMLLRSLAQDRVYSLESIAAALRENSDNDHQLELAQVAAARALGFNAKHVSGSGTPDGLARFLDSAMQETTLTLEAKASQGTPTLGHFDFSGLKRHKVAADAAGCLLVAPSYPASQDPNGAVSTSAKAEKISCWTVEQLARVVEASERLQITASQIADIVETAFTPMDVTAAVERLLADTPNMQALYKAIMQILRTMFERRSQQGDQRKV